MASAPKAASGFCSTCGFPLRGARCEACGGDGAPLMLEDVLQRRPPREPPASADLLPAIEAWDAGDLVRAVGLVVTADAGATVRAVATAEGPGWIAVVEDALLFVSVQSSNELLLEAPLVRLPSRLRVPALRLALELCDGTCVLCRLGLRRDLLLLRYAGRLTTMDAPFVRRLLREAGRLAARYTELLSVSFDARPAVPAEHWQTAGWETVGRSRRLANLAPPRPDRERTASGALDLGRLDRERSSAAAAPPPSKASPAAEPRAAPASAAELFGPLRPTLELEDLPPILAPGLAVATPGEAAKAPPAQDAPASAVAPSSQLAPTPTPPGARAARRGAQTVPDGAQARGKAAAEVEEPVRRPRATPDVPVKSEAARLCDLLRQAQSLGKLALEKRPATMPWLVRATVYRAAFEFGELLPGAVAHLYRCTAVGARDGAAGTGQATAGAPRPTGPTAIAEPALVVFERVLELKGQVPDEKPLELEPMTSAAQAKEHAARYLDELEHAPPEPPLRHFLGLGALTELLVRTKLPPQTDQRLRDIVAHAVKEGPKGAVLELMGTALQRIAAG